MIVHISNRQKAFKINRPLVKKVVIETISFEGQVCDEVSIHFVSKKEVSALHQQFFNDPAETDCISLPLDDSSETHYRMLGDVFICPEVALDYAEAHDKKVIDELMLYIIHGLLHLMGYDDIETSMRKTMRAAEKRHLAHLKMQQIL